ncbi:hypothetical protein BDZ94DRAFT_1060100 [Collybia nuda]|uniref:Uncharacterized protein n=1 Tax=Collybia nuda TaxID=64659 RepID=A0A9P6CB44_9AGAR|nr:hypothetical protein BDZ94DRAFT_1060100 [Collybia nuda]
MSPTLSGASQSSFRNPDTYLNHLSPSKGARFEFDRNIYLSVLGATIWDVLIYIPEDIRILRKDVGLVSLCFIFSRVFIIAFLILSVLSYTHPIANCQAMNLGMAVISGLGAACTAILFLRRAQAVYLDNRIIRWAFFCLWLVYVGTLVVLPFGLHGSHLSHTNYCITNDKKDFIIGSKIMALLFDTIIFFAVSYKIAMPTNSGHNIFGLSWNRFFSGRTLSRFSRAVLQGGQQYYLIMVSINLGNIIVLYIREASAYRVMFTPLSLALGASMACRVYRNIKLFEERKQSTAPPVVSASVNFKFVKNTTPTVTLDHGLGGSHPHARSVTSINTASLDIAEDNYKELKPRGDTTV